MSVVNEINIKLVILGNGGVGKTSLVYSVIEKEIPEMYMPTIGSNIIKKEFRIDNSDFYLRINVWDIGGQRSFNPLNQMWFSNNDAAFLVFDLSKPEETIKDIQDVYLKNLMENSEECITFILGNKLDLISDSERLKGILKQVNLKDLPLLTISAKNRDNVDETFELMVYSYLEKMEKQFPEERFQGLAEKFLRTIGKTEIDLKNCCINLKDVDSLSIQKKAAPVITKKVVEEEEKLSEDYVLIQQTIKNLNIVKRQIVDSFDLNMTAVEDLVLRLKETPIGILDETIDQVIDQLKFLRGDFELKLEGFLSLGREETKKEKD